MYADTSLVSQQQVLARTCMWAISFSTIPSAWIGQLHADGLVVTDLRGEFASSDG